jgi:hypothetical protein
MSNFDQWQDIDSAPIGEDLELAVINGDGVHALIFPCRRMDDRWIDSRTSKSVMVRPTHWRYWRQTIH